MMFDDDVIVAPDRLPSARVPPRFWVLSASMGVVLALLVGRSFTLQILRGEDFRRTAEGNRVAALPIAAPRGILYDASGKALTENIASTDVLLDPSTLPAEEDEAYLLEKIPALLSGITPEAVREGIHRARELKRPVVLKKAASHMEVLALEAAQQEIAGVRLVSALVRKYPYGEDLAHVVGYTGAVTAEELERNPSLLPIDTTGKIGLEKTYEDSLRGRPGYVYSEVNAAGRPQKDLGRQQPTAGKDLALTIDVELQQFIAGQLRDGKRQGAVVVLDPRDGAIKALVSFPTFDPNVFSQPGQGEAAASATNEPSQPLFNRALAGAYPPGSTIKPFLAVGGLAEGVIDEQTTVLSSGGIRIGQWYFPDWKASGHGSTDVKKAIAESVNTFFYLLAGGDETRTGLGVERATEYLGLFGWGSTPEIDLPGAEDGFLPSKAWKEKTKGERWYIGDTYHLGIGQGGVLVTPLQLADSTAAIANGTHSIQPHLSSDVTGKRKRLPFHAEHITIVREGMRQTVTEGSGRRLSSFPVAIAGKTGTAQVGGTDKTHAWFTSFGPYEEPQLVITVLLEYAGEGDDEAVPFTETIWRWWLENRHVAR